MTPRRPVLRYHGGKWLLAPWIISHFPHHKIYVEPFSGAASVLMRKQRAYAEVYNDLDEEIVNVFRVMQDPDSANKLSRLLAFTPYARKEFELSYEPSDDPVEQARRTIVRSYMGYSSDAATRTVRTGFKSDAVGDRRRHFSRDFVEFAGRHVANTNYNGREWLAQGGAVYDFCERLSGVIIECMDALEVIAKYDTERTLFYCDPPYLHSTRNKSCAGRSYRHEMTNDDHVSMIDMLKACKGMVVMSGYRSILYDDMLDGWTRYERPAKGQAGNGNGTKKTLECLWLSPKTEQFLQPKLDL